MELFAAIYHTEGDCECNSQEIILGIFDSRNEASETILKDYELHQQSTSINYLEEKFSYILEPRLLEDYDVREVVEQQAADRDLANVLLS
jgi:hypothetical protein